MIWAGMLLHLLAGGLIVATVVGLCVLMVRAAERRRARAEQEARLRSFLKARGWE